MGKFCCKQEVTLPEKTVYTQKGGLRLKHGWSGNLVDIGAQYVSGGLNTCF